MSQFVWLDYSEHERQKMLDIVDLFREHDTGPRDYRSADDSGWLGPAQAAS